MKFEKIKWSIEIIITNQNKNLFFIISYRTMISWMDLNIIFIIDIIITNMSNNGVFKVGARNIKIDRGEISGSEFIFILSYFE